jgi:hypothetical protein
VAVVPLAVLLHALALSKDALLKLNVVLLFLIVYLWDGAIPTGEEFEFLLPVPENSNVAKLNDPNINLNGTNPEPLHTVVTALAK